MPIAGDTITISTGNTVVFNVTSPDLAGVTVQSGAGLTFTPSLSATLRSTGSITVLGTLTMKPSSRSIVHLIKFVNVNEANYVGGGMEPVPADVGLWVRDGQLDLQGTPKTSWTRLAGGANASVSSITLEAAPTDWAAGDEISIVPTEAPSVGDNSWSGFDAASIVSVSGATVQLNHATSRAHPIVNSQWRAEVLNLTRNVRIEGTGNGTANPSTNHRAHIWIRSDKPQFVNYVAIRYMGPRHAGEDNPTEGVLGRYALHFHHSEDGSRGSTVRGTVVRDAGSHAFVPHGSHGITFTDTISYNTFDEAYWWDPGHTSHDTVYDHDVAAIVQYDPEYRGYNLAGFSANEGLRNTIRDSVAVGVQGNIDASGFIWPEGTNDSGIWNFSKGNIAHNNKVAGIFAWQNDHQPHVIANFVAYHNGEVGIAHGAYGNAFHYESSTLYGNGDVALHLKAVGPGVDEFGHLRLRFDNMIFDGGGQSSDLILSDDHNADGTGDSTIIRSSIFRNGASALHFGAGNLGDWIDLELCTISTPNSVLFDSDALSSNRVRLQSNTTQAFNITKSGTTSIPVFVQPYLDESLPQLSITSPSGGSVVTGVVSVSSYAYDLGGMASVDLYIDGVLAAHNTTAPFAFSWSTAAMSNGAHHLQLIGTDAAGNTNDSNITTVFTSNP
ncbi:Fibronectin type III domain protein [Minicystis rosea]|nr:Fibronectin type III domain protein [Minicystis rosea]